MPNQRPTRRQLEVLRAYIAADSVAAAAYRRGIAATADRRRPRQGHDEFWRLLFDRRRRVIAALHYGTVANEKRSLWGSRSFRARRRDRAGRAAS